MLYVKFDQVNHNIAILNLLVQLSGNTEIIMNAQDIVNPVRGARVSYCGICTPHGVPSGRPKLTTNAQETMDEEFMQA